MKLLKKFVNDDKEHKVMTNQVACLSEKSLWSVKYNTARILLQDPETKRWREAEKFFKKKLHWKYDIERLYRNGEI